MKIVGWYTFEMMNEMKAQLRSSNFQLLDLMHHFTSGQKAFFGLMVHQGVDELRMCCGGAGYSQWSLLPEIFSCSSVFPTVEGDTVVMAQQNAKLLFHMVAQAAKGKKVGVDKITTTSFGYIDHLTELLSSKSDATCPVTFASLDHLEKALAVRAGQWLSHLGQQMALAKKAGKSTNAFTNETHGMEIYELSKTHTMYTVFKIVREWLDKTEVKD